ncbi:AI-2E family transporter [Paraburkholderia acidisoli]|uniref:AI-2E family transporter n=1 Tax=Paraburkholderia acidisoli TaxID=2571748 RepID=A0A7Z2GLS7_9BURK|nr:AI-2E family transporter [Paraburkholderia acidisoli]QGZ64125.1 AI-2E family transporter [Paraburkholderia acidisoli]
MDGNKHLHQTSFYLLLFVVSIALCFVLAPFFSTVLWGAILALIFQPVQRRLVAKLGRRRNLAAFITLTICLLIVIFPLTLVTGTLVQQIASAYAQVRGGTLDIGAYFSQIVHALPQSIQNLLARYDLMDLPGLQQRLSAGAAQISQFVATRALSFGQNTLQFLVSFGVMLYLFFFLVRDGREISRLIRDAIPLDEQHKLHLIRKFTTVIRATVKGNVAVAVVQGTLGGIALWVLGIQGALLWGFVMMVLSLLPAVGAALVWAPIAVYFISTGALAKGIGLAIFGAVVIGTVDNVLRPVLVGKDTRLPDWAVLISTLGGISLIGINGFVIGPLIAALFISCWDLLRRDQHSIEHDNPNTDDDPV